MWGMVATSVWPRRYGGRSIGLQKGDRAAGYVGMMPAACRTV